jgi:hypothetical protein
MGPQSTPQSRQQAGTSEPRPRLAEFPAEAERLRDKALAVLKRDGHHVSLLVGWRPDGRILHVLKEPLTRRVLVQVFGECRNGGEQSGLHGETEHAVQGCGLPVHGFRLRFAFPQACGLVVPNPRGRNLYGSVFAEKAIEATGAEVCGCL